MIFFIAFSSAACSPENPQADAVAHDDLDIGQGIQITDNKVTIGLALGTLAEERWVNERKYFEEEAEKYGVDVITMDANMDENLQRAQIEDLIRKKVDVLVIVPVNMEASAASVLAAKDAGIPVLAYSRMISRAGIDAFIGFDAVEIGKALAEAAVEKVPEGNYMIINGSPVDNNAVSQQKGYYEILDPCIESGKIRVVMEQWCDNWSPEKAFGVAEAGLKAADNKIDAVIVSNDGMAGGVIRALKAQNLDGKVFVTGTDGDLSALRRIAESTQSVTLLSAKAYIDEHYTENITLNRISGYVHMSPNYFSSLFGSETGKSLMEYIALRRIEKAKQLLGEKGSMAFEVGERVGYDNPHYFSRVFRNIPACRRRNIKKA